MKRAGQFAALKCQPKEEYTFLPNKSNFLASLSFKVDLNWPCIPFSFTAITTNIPGGLDVNKNTQDPGKELGVSLFHSFCSRWQRGRCLPKVLVSHSKMASLIVSICFDSCRTSLPDGPSIGGVSSTACLVPGLVPGSVPGRIWCLDRHLTVRGLRDEDLKSEGIP